LKNFETYIESLIQRGIIPGISLLVGKGEDILLKKHYGFKSLVPLEEPLEENTLYDLASLTKPLVTALLILYLVEKEKGIGLDTPVKKIIPGFPSEMQLVHLLTHTAGFPAWYPFYLYMHHSDYLTRMKALPLVSRPGKKVNYTCVGYILLYYIIEKMATISFKEFARQVIIGPLGLKNTFFSVPGNLKVSAAPTEKGNQYEKQLAKKEHEEAAAAFGWREEMIRGEVHDCNSWYLGGTAGNAGLFSTAEEVFKMTRECFPATATILTPESLQYSWENLTLFKRSHRTVGFKRNSSIITSGGGALSREAIGHNGFTGTSLWLEPEDKGNGYTFILLTNRIHPVVADINFNKIRRKLHRLIVGELGAHRIHRKTLKK
jgi:CubicO group peptidase (beta-lactamase class C family)